MAFKQCSNLTHNARVRPKAIIAGGLVLLKSELASRNPSEGTLRPDWSGPYIVVAEPRRGIYRIKDRMGKYNKHDYHADDLRPYYV